jgi:4a-hydroxytetrahydrobiopterin dehydratase
VPNEGMIDVQENRKSWSWGRKTPDGWELVEVGPQSVINLLLKFQDFLSAFAFASKVALLAEKRKHHPDMTIGFNYVNLSLTTHAAGQTLTPADYKLAEEINKLPEVQERLGQALLEKVAREELEAATGGTTY